MKFLISHQFLLRIAPFLVVIMTSINYCFSRPQENPLMNNKIIEVSFKVDFSELIREGIKLEKLGIRGNLTPFSWEKNYSLQTTDREGVYEAEVAFDVEYAGQVLEYKYFYGEDQWELHGKENRSLKLTEGKKQEVAEVWNDYLPPVPEIGEMRVIASSELLKDFEIVKKSYLGLHPGLYRFNTEEEINSYFDELKTELETDLTLAKAYLAFSRFTAKIKCGHTYCNFYNQGKEVQQHLFLQRDKLPFAFRFIDEQMVIEKNISDNNDLDRGMQIIAINGMPVEDLVKSLLTVVKTDGSNRAQQFHQLNITGIGQYEVFDIYFPLFIAPQEGGFALDIYDHQTGDSYSTKVKAVSRSERLYLMEKKFGSQPQKYDDLWEYRTIDDETAYLKLGTFVTWQMEMDWKQFLKDALKDMNKKGVEYLMLDIRGNSGGMDEVNWFLGQHLIQQPLEIKSTKDLIKFEKVPEDIAPYLGTWDNSIKDLSGKVEPTGDGFYTWKGYKEDIAKIEPVKDGFKGKVYLLVDAANSSATFFLAKLFKQHNIATLVGQPTGGNLRGTTGGNMFFLNLPNSNIEMDIPLITTKPDLSQPDAGLEPDILVNPTIEDVIEGRDPVIEKVLGLIKEWKVRQK